MEPDKITPELRALRNQVEDTLLVSGKSFDLTGIRVDYDGMRGVAVRFTQASQHSIVVDLLKGFTLRYPRQGLRTIFVTLPKKPGPLARRIAALEAQVAELTKGKAPEVKPPPAAPPEPLTFESMVDSIEPWLDAPETLISRLRTTSAVGPFIRSFSAYAATTLRKSLPAPRFPSNEAAKTLVALMRPDLLPVVTLAMVAAEQAGVCPPTEAPPVRERYCYMAEYQRCVDKAEAALKANLAPGPLAELHKELHEPKTVRELEHVLLTFRRLAESEFPNARSTDAWRVARAVVAFYRPHLVSDI